MTIISAEIIRAVVRFPSLIFFEQLIFVTFYILQFCAFSYTPLAIRLKICQGGSHPMLMVFNGVGASKNILCVCVWGGEGASLLGPRMVGTINNSLKGATNHLSRGPKHKNIY